MFNDWGGRGYDDSVPGEVTKTPSSGDRTTLSPTWSASLPQSNSFHQGLVKYVPGRGYFRAVPSQNGDKFVTSPPPPSIVERVAPPVSPALPGDSKEDPNILSIGAELTEFRKLRELDPELSMKEYVDFKIYSDGKQKAARKRDGMDRPGRGRPSQEDARSQAPPEG